MPNGQPSQRSAELRCAPVPVPKHDIMTLIPQSSHEHNGQVHLISLVRRPLSSLDSSSPVPVIPVRIHHGLV